MTVRFAVERDAEGVLALIRATPELPQWSREALASDEAVLDGGGPQRRLMVAEDQGRVAGFALVAVLLDEAELEGIAVAEADRGRGTGRLLLERAIQFARSSGARMLRLEVRASNEAALQLYRSSGFLTAATRRNYYSNPVEDAVLLQLSWA